MWAQNEDGFTVVHLCSTSLAMQRAGISWVLGLDSSYLGALYCWEKKSNKIHQIPLVNFLKPQFLHSHTLPRSHLIHRQLIACCWLHLSGERLTLSRTFSAKWHRYPISS